ncbi:MAG: FtsQ-type POTRA domain-containing protein [Candidatus Gastranaerophilales bacterium]|nr:FtsQ-type POTRA domain-containing protein [Candidatus Gastranaerophilales bacterium]
MHRKIAGVRRQIRHLRMLLRVGLIFGLLYISWIILNLNQWYLNPDDIMNMNPDIVQIEGNVITPEYKISDIIRTSEPPDKQIFKYSTKQLEENLSKLQSVKKAYVRRFWFPARILVFIEEREPVFLIAPNKDSAPISAVTKDGSYMDREFMPIPSKFKTTKILSYGTGGDDYEKWDKKRVDEILKFIKKIETYSKQKVIYLDLRNPNDMYVQLDNIMLRLGALDDTTDDRIKWIPTILPEAKTLKQKVKYIDLRWKDTNYIKLDTESKDTTEET